MAFKNAEKVVKIATGAIIIYTLCCGCAMAVFPIRPFWNDEWRLVYNIKFKNVHQLWGTLDLLQQCPRVYLTVLKGIASFFDYSYISLRLPPLVISFFTILFCIHLKKNIFPGGSVYSYLFLLIFISSQTFTDYIVQVKQYEIELLLCLLALWQLITLLDVFDGPAPKGKYFLLCFSFLAAPFFSYTYPIAVAPIFSVILLHTIFYLRQPKEGKAKLLLSVCLPLLLVCGSIIVFYIIDVRQLMADNSMYASYKKMLGDTKGQSHFIADFWNLFALVGSGLVFEIIFGVLGIASFFYSIYRLFKIRQHGYTKADYLKLYGILLLALTLCLFLSGKLLGGVARLTAFTVPSIAILIVSFIGDVKTRFSYVKVAGVLATILFLGLFINIITSFINRFTYPEYHNRIETYWNTSKALKEARGYKIPILITKGLLGDKIEDHAPAPGKIRFHTIDAAQISGADTVCAEVVLKDNPEYKIWDSIPVYTIPDMKWKTDYVKQLPAEYKAAIICDGINFMRMER